VAVPEDRSRRCIVCGRPATRVALWQGWGHWLCERHSCLTALCEAELATEEELKKEITPAAVFSLTSRGPDGLQERQELRPRDHARHFGGYGASGAQHLL